MNMNKYYTLLSFRATLSFLNGKQDRPHIHCSHTAFAEGRIREGGGSCGLLSKEGLLKKVRKVIKKPLFGYMFL